MSMNVRKIKVGDRFDGYKVVGNRRWVEGCKGWVWDVHNPDGFSITITEAAIRQYIAAQPTQ